MKKGSEAFTPDLSLLDGVRDELTLNQLNIPNGEFDSNGLTNTSDHAPYAVTRIQRMAVKDIRNSILDPIIAPPSDLDTLLWEERQEQAS